MYLEFFLLFSKTLDFENNGKNGDANHIFMFRLFTNQ